jgi:hypothetical protein
VEDGRAAAGQAQHRVEPGGTGGADGVVIAGSNRILLAEDDGGADAGEPQRRRELTGRDTREQGTREAGVESGLARGRPADDVQRAQ